MELQNALEQQELTKKESMVKFVYDVAEMEIRALSLKEASIRCENESQQAIYRATQKIAECEEFLEKRKKERDELKKRGPIVPALNEKHLFDFFDDPYVTIGFAIFLFPIFLLYVLYELLIDSFIIAKKNKEIVQQHEADKKIALAEYHDELNKIDQKISQAAGKLKKAKRSLENEKDKAQRVKEKGNELREAADTIEEKIKQCYRLNVIKPAYQNFLCVVIMNSIFQNDKADTMREAMLLCDEVLRHQEIMDSLHDIISILSSISSYMREVSSTLESINMNISMISQDVYKIVEQQNDLLDSQNRIAYATESIQKSAENADMYIYQRRMGII